MSEPPASRAAPEPHAADLRSHALPLWEGAQSRRHARVPVWQLKGRAWAAQMAQRRALSQIDTMVNFVGYPRSGHSLVGAILDGHPQAAISHELDALGLFHKGIAAGRLPGLMAWNAAGFTATGRWWNGFRYDIGTGAHGLTGRTRVIGDKKGDWAARWSALVPRLVPEFTAATPLAAKWILVTRHPLDNIATLSLRKGGAYDRLRIRHAGTGGFGAALGAAQQAGEIAAAARDDMVEDWRAISAAVAQMKAQVAPDHWFELVYERFVADPARECEALCAFLGLDADRGWLDKAAAAVRPSRRHSRDSVTWTAEQRAGIARTVAARDFLEVYADAL